MEGMSVKVEEEQFEDMNITDEDKSGSTNSRTKRWFMTE